MCDINKYPERIWRWLHRLVKRVCLERARRDKAGVLIKMYASWYKLIILVSESSYGVVPCGTRTATSNEKRGLLEQARP